MTVEQYMDYIRAEMRSGSFYTYTYPMSIRDLYMVGARFYGISCSSDFLFPIAKTITSKHTTQWGISSEAGFFIGLIHYRYFNVYTGSFSILAGIDGITTFAGKENFYFSWGVKPVGYLFPRAFCGAFQLGTGWKLSPKVALEPIIGIQWIWTGTGLNNNLSCTTGFSVRFFSSE
jgi:hypothetical protein